jgi:hypothetical protein
MMMSSRDVVIDLVAAVHVASKADRLPTARFDRRACSGLAAAMTRLILLLAALSLLAGCANADGSRPRLSPAGSDTSGPAGFNGGYAGANNGFGNLTTKSVPF